MYLTVFTTKKYCEEGMACIVHIYNCNPFFLQDVKSHCLAFVRTIKSVSLSDTTRAAHFLDIGKTMGLVLYFYFILALWEEEVNPFTI